MSNLDSRLKVLAEDTTRDVKVEVLEVRYDPCLSDPANGLWVWVYTLRVTNLTSHPIILLRREWSYRDKGNAQLGEPTNHAYVNGGHPIIDPGATLTYTSGVPLPVARGTMKGWFLVELANGVRDFVAVPSFKLIAGADPLPARLVNDAPDPAADSALLSKAFQDFRAKIQCGEFADLVLTDIDHLSPRARLDLERYFLTNTFSAFNSSKADLVSLFDIEQQIKYLRLPKFDFSVDDRYIVPVTDKHDYTIRFFKAQTMATPKKDLNAVAREVGLPFDRAAQLLRDAAAPAAKPARLNATQQAITRRSPRRHTLHTFSDEELRDQQALNRARDTLADEQQARRKGEVISEAQQEAVRRAKALIRRAKQPELHG